MEKANREATMVELVILNQLKEVIELGLPIINGVNHTLGSRERQDLRVDVFPLRREGDDKTACNRRLSNQEHPISVDVRLQKLVCLVPVHAAVVPWLCCMHRALGGSETVGHRGGNPPPEGKVAVFCSNV